MSEVCSKALRWPATHFSRLEPKLVDFASATVYDVQHFTICIFEGTCKLISTYYHFAFFVSVCIYVCVFGCPHLSRAQIITSHTLLPCNLTLFDFGNLDGCFV